MIAVTGSSGWVGRSVCLWLEAQGHLVRRLTRRDPEFSFDLNDPSWENAWPKALRGCQAIVHCAAHVHRANESPAEKILFTEVNSRGTDRLLRACAAAGVERFVLTSTLAVYDWKRSVGARQEEDLLNPVTAYARSKLAAEVGVQSSDRNWLIARLATIYGEGDKANFGRLATALKRKRFFIPGKGQACKSVLPVGRAGEILGRLALLPDARNIVLNIAAPSAPSLSEICNCFTVMCGFAEPRRVPLALMRTAALAGEALKMFKYELPLTQAVLAKLTTSTVIDVSRQQSLLPDLKWPTFAESLNAASLYYANLD